MTWMALFRSLIGVIQLLDTRRAENQRAVDEALNVLAEAYFATLQYYDTTNWTSESEKKRSQKEIARLWDKAATRTRRFDNNLASRFSLKSRFWKDGAAWTSQEIEQGRIGLDEVRRDGRLEMLKRQK